MGAIPAIAIDFKSNTLFNRLKFLLKAQKSPDKLSGQKK
jgi:hypothetical protein